MRLRIAITALALLVSGIPAARASGSAPTAKSIGDGVICQCGCNQTVAACNHYMCSSRTEMQAMADKEIAAGKSETTILQDFVLRYGVKVLAAPPASGFNLTIWILPVVGFLAGLWFVVVIVRRWRRVEVSASPAGAPTAVDPKLLAEMEEEMKASGLGR
ncbi:MAG TPA: cytochrome c-type biogenesis protein CcmH [Terriglobia bacterium]|nr:cytochrome c-type biogenesis protein CcmH [Terriglobia bacterium]